MKTPETKSPLPVVGAVEHESKVEVLQAERVYALGLETVKLLGQAGEKYRDLCKFIRDNKVSKKIVFRELDKVGFKKGKVSELLRIANSGDKVWKEYEAKLIGFHEAVNLARMEDGKLIGITPAARQLAEGGALTDDEVDAIAHTEATPGSASGAGTGTKSMSARIKSAAKFIAVNAVRNAEYKFGDARYKVIVQKIEKTGPALGD